MQNQADQLRIKIKWLIAAFIAGLILSGLTAIPLESELTFLVSFGQFLPLTILKWLTTVLLALRGINAKYPFIAYGTDWLAFAHVMIAIIFIGPYKDPLKNIWVMQFGVIACLAILPTAFIAGAFRGIPFFWQLIDCSFGIFGLCILLPAYKLILRLQSISETIKH